MVDSFTFMLVERNRRAKLDVLEYSALAETMDAVTFWGFPVVEPVKWELSVMISWRFFVDRHLSCLIK
jgi:hypothetical protein